MGGARFGEDKAPIGLIAIVGPIGGADAEHGGIGVAHAAIVCRRMAPTVEGILHVRVAFAEVFARDEIAVAAVLQPFLKPAIGREFVRHLPRVGETAGVGRRDSAQPIVDAPGP
jgi:hypothetical protein